MVKKEISLVCTWCNNLFFKEQREYKRQIKKNENYRFFCSLKCSMCQVNKDNPHIANIENIPIEKRINGRCLDKFSPFRCFILRAKARAKRKKKYNNFCDLTCKYLKEVWDNQNGKCILSDIEMNLPLDTKGFTSKSIYNASLDRIDNSKGYVKGNVRFICVMANYARNDFNDDEVIEFCKKIYDFQNKTKNNLFNNFLTFDI